MIAKLNSLSESELQRLLHHSETRLAVQQANQQADPDVLRIPEFHLDLAVVHLDLLRCRYALGESFQVLRPLAAAAARHYLSMFQLRDLKEEEQRRLRGEAVDVSLFRPERMYGGVAAALIVNLQPVFPQFAAIPPQAYSTQYPPRYGMYHGCLGVLLDYLAGQKASVQLKATSFLAHWDSPGPQVPKGVRARLLPVVRGVRAVLEARLDKVLSELQALLATHEQDATEGEAAKELWTLLSLDALLLAAIAWREDLLVTIENRYMPLGLIA